MFVLYCIRDIVPIEPELLSVSYREAVTFKLEAKYVGKILKDEGVCIAIYELDLIESLMPIGSESLDCVVDFSLVLLKPFVGEILTGKILRTTREGLFISLEFCEVFVPAACLAHPSSYDEVEDLFVWRYGDHDLFYDIGQDIRFKVSHFILPTQTNKPFQIVGDLRDDGLGLLLWWVQ